MLTLPLLALLPRTMEWSPVVGIIMLFCNIVAIAIGRNTIQQPNVGPEMPGSGILGSFSLAALLGSASLGHILGAGVILGLSNLGVI